MKAIVFLTVFSMFLIAPSPGWEPVVTYTVQALSGLAGDTPRFDRVYCHDSQFNGRESAFPLICATNIPPTNSDVKLDDHNLLSSAGIKITAALDKSDGMKIVLDLTTIKLPTPVYDGPAEDLIRYALECIRLTAVLSRVPNYSVDIRAPKNLEDVAARLGKEFKSHDKAKPFTHHPAEAGNG